MEKISGLFLTEWQGQQIQSFSCQIEYDPVYDALSMTFGKGIEKVVVVRISGQHVEKIIEVIKNEMNSMEFF